jgi:hypothetical protein
MQFSVIFWSTPNPQDTPDIPNSKLQKCSDANRTKITLQAGLWIRIDLMRIRIQFRVQGFMINNLKKILQLENFFVLFW